MSVSSAKNYFISILTDGSILHGLDQKRIAEEKQEYKDQGLSGRVGRGIQLGAKQFTQGIILNVALAVFLNAATGSNGGGSHMVLRPVAVIILAPIAEELIFRGVAQNGIYFVQKGMTKVAPEPMKQNQVFIWVVSPSARILATNSIFAAVHLSNAWAGLSARMVSIQVISLMYRAQETVLYETNGGLSGSIACHMTNNLAVVLLVRALA